VLFDVVTEEVARLLGADAANLVRFDPRANEGLIVGKWSEPGVRIPGAGTRVDLLGGTLERVFRTGRPARGGVDDPDNSPELVARLTDLGVTSLVAAPIAVSGELWGAVVVSVTGDQTFAPDAEERIGQFAGLVAVALANAEAREQLSSLAEEQAALSRVAVAVATASEPEVLFNVVTEEVAHRLGSDAANLIRFEPRNELEGVVVGRWATYEAEFASLGTRIELTGGPVTRVRRTGRPARGHIDDPDIMPSKLVDQLRDRGVRSMVAAPIEVSGQLWGAVVVSLTGDRTFAPDAERRIGQFASLVAVALANAEAREQLSGLAKEQAALSRVAVAVATEEEPDQLFNAVSREIGLLFGAQTAETVRYLEGADEAEVVGGWKRDPRAGLNLGGRLPFQGGAITRVARTRRPARIDLDTEPPDIQQHMRDAGVTSGVAAPIVVSGRLWGATSISILGSDPFPPDAEERLEKFTNLVAVALANAEAREELTASRARIVQAGDAARRRLERNLHDGAQQRLVTLSLTLRLAQARLDEDAAAARELLDAASGELASALEELRELARGLHPAILSDRGLGAALEALATRAPVPVELGGVPPERLPPPVEAAAYYVVAESLTNVAKYAEASSAHVSVVQDNGFAIVEVVDDGVGGVDLSRGSGLRGLADRVEALDGRLTVSSEAGRGTRIRAEIPCTRS
jgi:signal transduction histidine kinase